jgi:hypothetical protein
MATQKLTARTVETVTTKENRVDIADADIRGLQLRVTFKGTKSCALRYTRSSDGKRRRRTYGKYPRMSLAEARQQALEDLAAVGRGAAISVEPLNSASGHPFRHFCYFLTSVYFDRDAAWA